MFHVEQVRTCSTWNNSGSIPTSTMDHSFTIRGNIVDVVKKVVYPGEMVIKNGIIREIKKETAVPDVFLAPGFIDAHIHIESSMVTPLEFSKMAVRHGTVGTVSDPHEIANVLGREGIDYMIGSARRTPLKIMFGAPSCVPATPFESSGSELGERDILELLREKEIGFLSEVMNYPGVISRDEEVMMKIGHALENGLPVDGHAPGLMGEDLKKYASAGISTDHECFSIEEAREKITAGMMIQIREGSGAKNFSTLIPLLAEYPERIMFCSDDLHPDDLVRGHINLLVQRALSMGYNVFDVLRAAGYNAIRHYQLEVGLLQEGDPADFLVMDSLDKMNIQETYINGSKLWDGEKVHISGEDADPLNVFLARQVKTEDLKVDVKGKKIHLIEAIDGELITRRQEASVHPPGNQLNSDTDKDILKMVVINRYMVAPPAIGFIRGFQLKHGAIASSIAHDSHNIICVGVGDDEIETAVNWIIGQKGGIVAVDGQNIEGLPLPVGGIMTTGPVEFVAKKYDRISNAAKQMGSKMQAPFMTLAFMALLVIPELKLSDRGLFDGNAFRFIPLFKS